MGSFSGVSFGQPLKQSGKEVIDFSSDQSNIKNVPRIFEGTILPRQLDVQSRFPPVSSMGWCSFVLPFAVGCGQNHNVADRVFFFLLDKAALAIQVLLSAPEGFKR